MYILGIETSSKTATVAIMQDDILLVEYTINNPKTHSHLMQPMVHQALGAIGLSLSDIDVFACGVGPGSFTGIRIGVSMIKGFADSLKKPVAPVGTLSVLKNNISSTEGKVISLIFARADEVFYGIYEGDFKEEGVLTIDELLEKVKDDKCIFCGDGAIKFEDKISEVMGKRAIFVSKRHNSLSAAAVCEEAYLMAQRNELIDSDKLAPVYMRQSQAEREFG